MDLSARFIALRGELLALERRPQEFREEDLRA
jgi:hypothetical protein